MVMLRPKRLLRTRSRICAADGEGRRRFKRNMSVELAVDAMELAKHVDQIVLFSGDGDFRPLVESVQRRGVRVTVVSTILRPAADDRRRVASPSRRFHRSS